MKRELKEKYSFVGRFEYGLAPVKDIKSGRWGAITTAGILKIPCMYLWVGDFSSGIAPVRVSYGMGFINKHGDPVTPMKYRDACNVLEVPRFEDKSGNKGYIDLETGNEVYYNKKRKSVSDDGDG